MITDSNEYVVEQYIKNPLLVDKKKFDIRFYIVITSVEPLIAFLYEEGIVRFCTEEY